MEARRLEPRFLINSSDNTVNLRTQETVLWTSAYLVGQIVLNRPSIYSFLSNGCLARHDNLIVN